MKNTWRLVWILLVVTMVLFAGGVVAGYLWINRYLASDAFRLTVSRAASRALQVDGEFEPFRWSGLAIYSGGFDATGAPEAAVDRMVLHQLHASLNLAAAFHGVWEIDQLEVGELKLTLKEPLPPPPVPPVPPPPEPLPGGGLLPHTFRIDTVRIDTVGIVWPVALGGGGEASGMTVDMSSMEGENGWTVLGKRGTFTLARFPVEEIQDFALRIRPDRLYVTKAELRNQGQDQGSIRVTGELGLGAAPDLDFHFEIANFPITPLLPADWRARLYGNLASEFHLTRAGDPGAPWHIEGKAHLDDSHLEAVPILDQIALLTQSKEYRTLKFQTASAAFVLGPDRMEFNDVAVESEGFVRAEGNIVRQGDALSGTVNLGLPSSRLSLLPGVVSQIFTESRGIYVWTPVQIGGTVDHPTEDLSPRVTAAIVPAIKEGVQKTVDKAVDLFNGLLRGN